MQVAVLGAGVVGLAVAEVLSRAGHAVTILEKNARIGEETSSRNSEVIHAGIYYPAGSLKARLCVDGRARLLAFCDQHRVPWQATGKLIVATADDELPGLDAILAKAATNGTEPLLPLDAAEIHARYPNVRAIAALWSTGTGIIDSHALMAKLAQLAQQRGADLLLRHRVEAATRIAAGWRLTVVQPDQTWVDLHADAVVNAAGLWADDVARLVVDAPDLPKHTFLKGNYFDIVGPSPAPTLVYPVPSPSLSGLGTHLTVDLAGRGRLGPDVEPAQDRHDYTVDPMRLESFLAAAQRFLPGLTADRLRPAYAGVRPKLATDRVADFWIAEETGRGAPGWVNLLGIESPGLTASLAIAAHVASLLE